MDDACRLIKNSYILGMKPSTFILTNTRLVRQVDGWHSDLHMVMASHHLRGIDNIPTATQFTVSFAYRNVPICAAASETRSILCLLVMKPPAA